MNELELLFQQTSTLGEDRQPAPGNPMALLRRRRDARRRRRLAAATVPLAALSVAAVAILPIALDRDEAVRPSPADQDPELVAPADVPTSLVGLRAGRAVAFDGTTGAQLKDYGPASAVAPGPSGVWVATATACASTLRYVPPTSDSAFSEFKLAGRVTAIAASPAGTTIAFAEERPSAGQPDDVNECGPADLVLLDVPSGVQRRWSGAAGSALISQLSWSSDGSRLAFQTTICCDATTDIRVLNPESAPVPVTRVPAALPDRLDCHINSPGYAGSDLLAVRRCPSPDPVADPLQDLVRIRPDRSVEPVGKLPQDTSVVALGAHPTHVLVAMYGDPETPGRLLRVTRSGTATALGTGVSQPQWASESPPSAAPSPRPTTRASSDARPPAPEAAAAPRCEYVDRGDGGDAPPGPPPATAADLPGALTIATNRGDIRVQLETLAAPCTVNSFRHLAAKGFYDGTDCHRITTQGIFVLQCGDPTGTGSGGPGYVFADENIEGATYPRGTVAMVNAGPGTNRSQFFIVYKDTRLDPNYTPFGRVIAGLDLVEEVAAAGSTPADDGTPNRRVRIERVRR